MIREKTTDVEVLTTLGADRLKMGIDEDGLVQVTDLLTNMYSDEELAVLREYATNAYDSHIAAGQTRPIEITLPISAYELASETRGHFLRIRDYGTGLSVEEIATIYSRYGKSTKDKSNEQQGFMGIGGKSGLVETFGSFKINAVKDGQRTIVMVGRDESGAPVMDLVSVTDTDDANGVEIELPVAKYHNLRRKADNLFKFWPEGSVLVDGNPNERLKPKIEITPNIWVCEGLYSKNRRTDFIVMGNVPYPIDLDGKLADDHSLVIFVDIGAVMPTPSRESLRMTPETKEEIARLMAEYDQQVKSTIQNNVDQAKTKAEAVKTMLKWRSAFATEADMDVTYKGHKIPLRFDVPDILTSAGTKRGIVITKHDSNKLSRHDRQRQIYIGTLADAVLVHGFTGANFAPVHKQKLEHWAKGKGLKPEHYVLSEKRIAHGWVDSTMRVDWETIKKIKVTEVRGGRYGEARPKGSYPMWVAGEWSNGTAAEDIDTNEPIFWHAPDFFSTGYNSYRRNRKSKRVRIFERYPTATFVELTSNRVNKFKRDFPQARHSREVLTEIFNEFKATVKKSDLVRIKIREDYADTSLSSLDPTLVNDPAVRKAIRIAKRPLNQDMKNQIEDMRSLVGYSTVDDDPTFKVTWTNPLNKYPLANYAHLEHTYLYINAVYAKEGNK